MKTANLWNMLIILLSLKNGKILLLFIWSMHDVFVCTRIWNGNICGSYSVQAETTGLINMKCIIDIMYACVLCTLYRVGYIYICHEIQSVFRINCTSGCIWANNEHSINIITQIIMYLFNKNRFPLPFSKPQQVMQWNDS